MTGTMSNAEAVRNLILDDQRYVQTLTSGNQDLYTLQPILNAPAVLAVQVSGAYRMDDSTQQKVRNTLNAGGTASEGVDHYINQSFTYYRDIWELNPHTGLGWTGAEVNALKIGPKLTT